jgi:hypothetical protein
MSIVTKPKTFAAGTTAVAADVNSDFDTIYNDYNGNITDANINVNANISSAKLASITSGGKVSGTALTGLTGIPSAAGLIPIANIDTGVTDGKIVKMTTGDKLPAVDGSLLTNLGVATSLSTASGSAPSYSARAWANFNGTGTPAILASGNVSSITDNGTGDYTVNFTTAMADAKYCPISSSGQNASANPGSQCLHDLAVGSFIVTHWESGSINRDISEIYIAVFR